MSLKSRIAGFLEEMLFEYKLTQREMADVLRVGLGSLQDYLKARCLPRIEIAIRIAELGGLTLDELVKTDKPPEKKEIYVA